MSDEVQAWSETIKIPTHKNPMFLKKRVYQGNSGAVYPHPVIDRVFDEKEDKEYIALYLENRYLKMMIRPEALAQGLVASFWPSRKGQMQNISTPMANRMQFEGEEFWLLLSFAVIPEYSVRVS